MKTAGFLKVFVLCALGGQACGGPPRAAEMRGEPHFSDVEWRIIRELSPLGAQPADPTNAVADRADAARLGQKFYYDARFSGPLVHADNDTPGGRGRVGETGRISCATCHAPAMGFCDQSSPGPTSLAARWTGRSAPTVINAAYNVWQFWDGRKDSLWSQALGPIESPAEHNFNRVAVVQLVRRLYRADYEALFGPMAEFSDPARFPQVPNPPAFEGQGRPGDGSGGAGLDSYDELAPADRDQVDRAYANFGKCIAAYERLIVSRDSTFDRFVAGEAAAMGESAQRGLKLFIGKASCLNCHHGPNFSDGEFHNAGVAQAGPHAPSADPGRHQGAVDVKNDRFGGAGRYSDDAVAGRAKLSRIAEEPVARGQFKTPTLRSVSRTAPYFHTGTAPSLRAVVDFYNRGGDAGGFDGVRDEKIFPLNLTDPECEDLVAFLKTLDGAPLDAALLEAPLLPR